MRPLFARKVAAGERMVKERFGVDEAIWSGDHACVRLSGCPSLSLKHTDDPLKDDPVAAVDNACVGRGNCGEVAEAEILCPSFYRTERIFNATRWDRALATLRACVIGWLQRRRETHRIAFASARVQALAPERSAGHSPDGCAWIKPLADPAD